MKKRFLILFLIISTVSAVAQEMYYTAPLKIPLLLSGSFAELRSNHFHSGMDIKTQGVTGLAVSAAAKGYVSRISVSPTGFGNALYINHPNGTTTVYGHLSKFRDDIKDYIKIIQYELKSFQVDISVSEEVFPVEQNELIALSGNTGSSGGPHLHFEIRNTQTEEPLNPLDFGFNIIDKIPPTISGLQIATATNNSVIENHSKKKIYPVVFFDGKYQLANNPVISVSGDIGFAIEAYDYFDGSPNKCGLSKIQLTVDGEFYFLMSLHRFSFEETRYINSFIDYEDFIIQKRKFQKAYIDPGNKLRLYDFNKNNGIISAIDDQIHIIDIEVEDAYGNRSALTFRIRGKFNEPENVEEENSNRFEWDRDNIFKNEDVELDIPKGNLFNTFNFRFQKFTAEKGYLSDIYQLSHNTVPLFKGAKLKIKPNNLDEKFIEKTLLVYIDPISGKYSAAGGTYENGWVSSEIKTMGLYAIRVDTIAPVIKPLSITNKNTLTEKNRLRFTITDDLSGINKYEGYIDGEWVLFEYDAKNNRITHYFDTERFVLNRQHQLKLVVSDYKNNTSVYEATFQK